jgi:ATP-dependent protease HslVU (ClpYQ) peptidase subunit
MTVIMGINLSDRIIFTADSRVSYVNEKTGETVVKHDNMQKIEPIEGVHCVIASAGDARFAQFIIKGIQKDFKNAGIDQLRDEIEEWAKLKAQEYFQRYYSIANFIIAGVSDKNKVISRTKFFELLDAYAKGKPVAGSVKSLLSEAIQGSKDDQGEIELSAKSTNMFSLRISRNGVKIEDADWGSILISGPEGVSKEDIEPADIGRFEFEYDSNKHIENDSILATAIMSHIINTKRLESVGGSILPMIMLHTHHLATMPTRIFSSNPDGTDVQFVNAYALENNRLYRVEENGSKHRMYKVSEIKFDDLGKDQMSSI